MQSKIKVDIENVVKDKCNQVFINRFEIITNEKFIKETGDSYETE